MSVVFLVLCLNLTELFWDYYVYFCLKFRIQKFCCSVFCFCFLNSVNLLFLHINLLSHPAPPTPSAGPSFWWLEDFFLSWEFLSLIFLIAVLLWVLSQISFLISCSLFHLIYALHILSWKKKLVVFACIKKFFH